MGATIALGFSVAAMAASGGIGPNNAAVAVRPAAITRCLMAGGRMSLRRRDIGDVLSRTLVYYKLLYLKVKSKRCWIYYPNV